MKVSENNINIEVILFTADQPNFLQLRKVLYENIRKDFI